MSSIIRTHEDTLLRRPRHARPRVSIRAESRVRVNDDFGEIIRQANMEKYENFNFENDIPLLDAHNGLINYLKNILPTKIPNCHNQETGIYQLCPVLRNMFGVETFDPKDARLKWQLIMRNVTVVNSPTSSPPRASPISSPPALPVPPSGQFEPAPINENRQLRIENELRAQLRKRFEALDIDTKKRTRHDAASVQEVASTEPTRTGHWEYPRADEAADEPAQKRARKDVKVDENLSDAELCIICMEKRRTHAFLHAGLAGHDVTAHFVTCESCTNSCYWAQNGCPCCRTPVVNVIRVLN